MTFRKDCVEGQRGLTRTTETGDDSQSFSGNGHADVLQVMYPRAYDFYVAFGVQFKILNSKLALECFDGFFDGGDAGLSVNFLLTLQLYDLRFGVLYEAFVAQFGHDAAQETLLVSKICL